MMWVMALGMALFLEGIFLGLSPKLWRKTVSEMLQFSDTQISRIGLGLSVAAVLLILLAYWGSAS